MTYRAAGRLERDVNALDRVEQDLVHVDDPPDVLSGDVALAREGLDLAKDADVGVDPAKTEGVVKVGGQDEVGQSQQTPATDRTLVVSGVCVLTLLR